MHPCMVQGQIILSINLMYVHVYMYVILLYHTVGEFNGQPSIQYCMTLSNTEIDGNIFNESTSEDRK